MKSKRAISSKRTRVDVGGVILGVIKIAGLISVAAIAPNALQVFASFGLKDKNLRRRKYYVDDAISRLKKRGAIKIVKHRGKGCVEITQNGLEELLWFEMRGLAGQKKGKWDRKYRVIIFDVKEGKKKIREELRRLITEFGFVRIQDSVWVYPYECQELVILLKSHLQLGKELIYMEVSHIENDSWLKKTFKLD